MLKDVVEYFRSVDCNDFTFDDGYFRVGSFWFRCVARIYNIPNIGDAVQMTFFNSQTDSFMVFKEKNIILVNKTGSIQKTIALPEDKNEYFQMSTTYHFCSLSYDDLLYMYNMYRALEPKVWEYYKTNY